jgi:hypothetical protein
MAAPRSKRAGLPRLGGHRHPGECGQAGGCAGECHGLSGPTAGHGEADWRGRSLHLGGVFLR